MIRTHYWECNLVALTGSSQVTLRYYSTNFVYLCLLQELIFPYLKHFPLYLQVSKELETEQHLNISMRQGKQEWVTKVVNLQATVDQKNKVS